MQRRRPVVVSYTATSVSCNTREDLVGRHIARAGADACHPPPASLPARPLPCALHTVCRPVPRSSASKTTKPANATPLSSTGGFTPSRATAGVQLGAREHSCKAGTTGVALAGALANPTDLHVRYAAMVRYVTICSLYPPLRCQRCTCCGCCPSCCTPAHALPTQRRDAEQASCVAFPPRPCTHNSNGTWGAIAGLVNIPPTPRTAPLPRLLGHGGFAAVYEVERASDGCRMAAKVRHTPPTPPSLAPLLQPQRQGASAAALYGPSSANGMPPAPRRPHRPRCCRSARWPTPTSCAACRTRST